jgi:hypothetical protein
MDPTSRLRIATRIHYALLRQLGTGIDVGYMLKREDYAREVLYVCEGSGDPELASLARKFERASIEATLTESKYATLDGLQPGAETDWSSETSGSGATRMGDLDAGPDRTSSRWLTPSRWLDLKASTTVH